jgi:hypothetical protein
VARALALATARQGEGEGEGNQWQAVAYQSAPVLWPLLRIISGARYSGVPHSVHVFVITCVMGRQRWVKIRISVEKSDGERRGQDAFGTGDVDWVSLSVRARLRPHTSFANPKSTSFR